MLSSRRTLALAAIVVLAFAAGAWLGHARSDHTPELRAGTWLPQRRALQTFALRDANDRPFGPAQLAGQPNLIFFGFTQCPDVCPTTLAMLAQLRQAAKLPTLRVIMISVDPQRDTSAVLRRYLAAFDTRFVGLTGSLPAMTALTRDIGVAVTQVPLPGGGYTVDHSATIFLTDAQGRVAAVFTPPFDEALLLADLRAAWPHLQG